MLVYPRPSVSFVNDVGFVVPSRPIFPFQSFSVPIYGHATYSIAAYSVVCQVHDNLEVVGRDVDNRWLAEVRELDINEDGQVKQVGVVAILRNPEQALEAVRIEPELLFSLQVQALSTARPGGNDQVNCTVVYLSNIFNEKIRPRGLTTPTPALAVGDSTTEPGFGRVTVVQPSQRGLFSFPSQSQVANTAVLNDELVSVMLTHQVVLSDGAIFQPDSVECTSDSTAFQLTSSCDQIVLNGTEPFGTNRGDVIVTYQNLSAVVSLRVWYPSLPADVQLSTETLRPIEGWLAAGRDGQCSQQYQQASLECLHQLHLRWL